jgi:DNA-binding XRE family transcriptional regulator
MIMPKTDEELLRLGNCFRDARNRCSLTQQELAEQCELSIKTIQNIENGRMNPSFEILTPLVKRLGILGTEVFNQNTFNDEGDIQRFLGKFNACNPENRKILLNTLECLSEQLLALQRKTASEKSE